MQATPPAPPAPPIPPVPPIVHVPGQGVVVFPGGDGASPQDVYQALKAQRRELGNQLENLEDKRRDLSQRLEEPMVGGADRKGLEGRITEIDCWEIARVAKRAGAPANAAAGVRLLRTVGDQVDVGEPLFEIHAQSAAQLAFGRAYAESATDLFRWDS